MNPFQQVYDVSEFIFDVGIGAAFAACLFIVVKSLARVARTKTDAERQQQIEDMARAMMLAKEQEAANERRRRRAQVRRP